MSIRLGDLSIRYVAWLLDCALRLGLDTQRLRQQFKFDDSLMMEPDARVSIERFMRLGHEVITLSQRPDLGLVMAEHLQPQHLGLVGYLLSSAPNLEQALQDMARFEALNSHNARGQSRVSVDDKYCHAEFYSISPYNGFNYFVVDLALACQLSLLRQLSPQTMSPAWVEIEFAAPAYAEHYERFWPCPVRFNQPRNAVVFKRSDLATAPVHANALAYAETLQLCVEKTQAKQKQLSFLSTVMSAMTPLLAGQHLSLQAVADRLELPPWTLQRKLKAENTSFKQLSDETRKGLSLIYLKDASLSLSEVSYLLGFANPSALQRAVLRWHGEAPGALRKRLR